MNNFNTSTIPTMDYYQTVPLGFSSYLYNDKEKDLEKNIFIRRIKNYILLNEGWDSYGALKISNLSIEKSCSFIQKLYNWGHEVYFVAPTPDGEVLVELKNKNKSAEIKFLQDSRIIYTLFENDSTIQESEIESDEDLKNILHLFYN